jgi:hypothetical protein
MWPVGACQGHWQAGIAVVRSSSSSIEFPFIFRRTLEIYYCVRDLLVTKLHTLTWRAKSIDVTRELASFLRKLWDQIVSPIVNCHQMTRPSQSHLVVSHRRALCATLPLPPLPPSREHSLALPLPPPPLLSARALPHSPTPRFHVHANASTTRVGHHVTR